MFTKIKNATILAIVIHFSGVWGHGFVRKITIDGVESVFHVVEFFKVNSLYVPVQLPWYKPVSPLLARFRPAGHL